MQCLKPNIGCSMGMDRYESEPKVLPQKRASKKQRERTVVAPLVDGRRHAKPASETFWSV